MKVYLAGGMRSGWQNDLAELVETDIVLIDPRQHGFEIPEWYTPADILGVKQCDVLVAYLEKDNPSGLGMAFEMGLAKSLGKTIIMVDDQFNRYTEILRQSSDYVVYNLGHVAEILNTLSDYLRGK